MYCIAGLVDYKWSHADHKFGSEQIPRRSRWSLKNNSRIRKCGRKEMKPAGDGNATLPAFRPPASSYMPGGGGTCKIPRQQQYSLKLTQMDEYARVNSAYRIIASIGSGRRPTRRWRRWRIIIWGSRWSRTRSTCLLRGLLLVVLVVCHIILVTTISRIRVLAAVILRVVGGVIRRTTGSWRAGRRWGRSSHW